MFSMGDQPEEPKEPIPQEVKPRASPVTLLRVILLLYPYQFYSLGIGSLGSSVAHLMGRWDFSHLKCLLVDLQNIRC